MKKFALMFLPILILAGCGGGGKGPISPPTPPPPSPPPGSENPYVYLAVNSSRVKPGDVVSLELTAKPDPMEVEWRQSPSTPEGRFSTISTLKAEWRAPQVTIETRFVLTAVVYFANSDSPVEASVIVTVAPTSPPPVNPPKVYISYPNGLNNDNVVGPGVKLQVFGRLSAGTYPVSRLEVLVDGRVVVQLDNPSLDFQFDVEEFGVPGTKQLVVRVIDSQGNAGEATVEIENDPVKLEQLAREFLRQYCSVSGKAVRFGDLTDGPYTKSIYVELHRGMTPYVSLVEQACSFWEKYTGIKFIVLPPGQVAPTNICIVIHDKFEEDLGNVAATAKRGFENSFKVSSGYIQLYKGWLQLSDELKSLVVAHELSHILVIPDSREGHTQNGSFMDGGATEWYFHPYMQRAVRILYSKNPGDYL